MEGRSERALKSSMELIYICALTDLLQLDDPHLRFGRHLMVDIERITKSARKSTLTNKEKRKSRQTNKNTQDVASEEARVVRGRKACGLPVWDRLWRLWA